MTHTDMPATVKKCAHPSCKCEVSNDDKYCSPYCSDAAGTTEIFCNCGHPGCSIADEVPVGSTVGEESGGI